MSKETNSGHAFISYKDSDHKKYVSHVTALQEIFGNEILGFDMTLKVKQDLIGPTEREAVEQLIKIIDKEPDFKRTYAKAASRMHIFKPSGIIEMQLDRAKSDKEISKVYRDISLAAAISSDFREKYFSKLKNEGFNSMMDGGDMNGKGANTESPILIFERNGYVDVVDTKRIKI